ncbi:lipopolysaccharide transport periplasmic protein LptA [Pararobbsia silviterrae]|uniref:Lipopolysaccharide export system protein LptA n=1 Tax=Pararobbsia silviterrae TaxID=1792498 RepID=A0A494Y814_9BURK|nr:lipopolysaccharide transport periplasmic protein LptA [Pararobbsia silviterrae]RKP58841.1 lipopolysaccharide transport periplasmic protein LptA [Pararobbsia silviterrae]
MTLPPDRRPALPARLLAAIALLIASLLPATAAHAERADRDKPVFIDADNMTYDDLKQVNVYIGHVVLTKGTILIKADRAVVTQDPQGYQYAVATMDSGGLAYFREKRDGLDEYIEGNADKLEYDGKRDFTTLTGRAIVRRLQGLSKVIDTVSGDVITYDGQKDFYTASSTSGSSTGNPRVHAMLSPAYNNGASAPVAASASRPADGGNAASPAAKTPGTDKQ